MVRKIADDSVSHFAASGDIGRKYLVDHSAGSGKTLSICWLADRLHSLFKPGTSEKVVNVIFILTDRKSLDTNIREDIEKFTHLKDVIGLARKADDLPRFLNQRKPIIVTTQQKFVWVLEEIEKNQELNEMRVAFCKGRSNTASGGGPIVRRSAVRLRSWALLFQLVRNSYNEKISITVHLLSIVGKSLSAGTPPISHSSPRLPAHGGSGRRQIGFCVQ